MIIKIAQINPVVGDIRGNLEKHKHALRNGIAAGVDLVVFPELSLCGYPPKDLVLHPDFISALLEAECELAEMTTKTTGVLFGTVKETGRADAKPLQNVAVLAYDGWRHPAKAKRLLPTYDVFDEARYFQPAFSTETVSYKGKRLGITICEDIWNDKNFWQERLYDADPVSDLVGAGADLIVNLSASPFSLGKPSVRRSMLSHSARRHGVPIVYVNQVGGNDDVLYDGRSMVFDAKGNLVVESSAFSESWVSIDVDKDYEKAEPAESPEPQEIFDALVMGTRDYVTKCGFKKVVLGLSGGIDSAVVAAIAAKALRPENVLGVSMPSKFSSEGSVWDAKALAERLGICFDILPIKDVHDAYKSTLRNLSEEKDKVELWEENIQARIRGAMLMAISNKEGRLLLTTGNKSEVAMGYCTLYGDTCGGLAVISDVFKTQVFELARYINKLAGREVIPEATITKAPSAELRPGQYDQETLPPYPLLDSVLKLYIEEENYPLDEIARKTSQSLDFVKGIIRKVDANEYKRKQLAPGLRITRKAFGCGRVMPIAQGWKL